MEFRDPTDPTYCTWIGDDTAPNIGFWPLQWASNQDESRGLFTRSQAQALFEQALGATFSRRYEVRYERDMAWMARFAVPARPGVRYFDVPRGTPFVPVEVCFNAPYHWRISQQHGFTSTVIRHHDDPTLLLHELEQAIAQIV